MIRSTRGDRSGDLPFFDIPSRVGRLVFLSLWVVGLATCASPPPTAIVPGPFRPLGTDEGLVVIQIDTDVAIERIALSSGVVASALQAGQHLWLIRAKSGRDRWESVKLLPQTTTESSIRPEAIGVLNEREFEFDVVAGAINYPGEIVIRMRVPQYGIRSGVSVRNRNHSAMAIRRLAKTHAALLAAHPIRYAGSSGDTFLEDYTTERDRVAASKSVPRKEKEN